MEANPATGRELARMGHREPYAAEDIARDCDMDKFLLFICLMKIAVPIYLTDIGELVILGTGWYVSNAGQASEEASALKSCTT